MDLSYLDLLVTHDQEEDASVAEGGGGVWVVADTAHGALAAMTLQALGAARMLANSVGAYVQVLLLGDGVEGLGTTLFQAGADGVRVADHPWLSPFSLEPHLGILCHILQKEQPEIVLLGATRSGQELAGRIAHELGGGLIEHVCDVRLDEASRTVRATFPMYGGQYFQVAACPQARPQLLTIEPGAFNLPFLDPYRRGEVSVLAVDPVPASVRVTGPAIGFEPPIVRLADAAVVCAAGRQAGNIDLVRSLSDAVGAHIAGDRGARDAGWITAEQLVDIRAGSIAPEVYLAIGIRGDTFHNAAIKDAGFIAAIHPDPRAPIFDLADVCLVAEPEQILPWLLEGLRTDKSP